MPEVRGNCPQCVIRKGSEDVGRHFHWNTEKREGICFRCNWVAKGNAPIPLDEEYLPARTGQTSGLLPTTTPLYDLLHHPEYQKGVAVTAARKYLEKHHVDPYRIAFQYRLLMEYDWLVFPIYNAAGKITYYQKRNVFTKKFDNPSCEHKPLFWTEHENAEPVVLVESWMNAVRIDPWARSAAVFGKYLSDDQAEEIAGRAREVVVCLDSGELFHSLRISRKLQLFGVQRIWIREIKAPEGTDLCDLDDERCRKVLKL